VAAAGLTMRWIVSRIKWIMLVAGLLTCSMAWMALAPQSAMQSTFGMTLEGPLAEIIVRNWALLIALGGGLLIYGAWRPAVRPAVLAYAGLGKFAFIGLVLMYHETPFDHPVGVAVVADSIMVILFAACLAGSSHPQ
jgi:hypothetical protein